MPTLARHLGLWALIVYGIGDILGAGIYALVGKVIGTAGNFAWVSFVLAAGVAILTGLSYAELSARYPVAAGAAAFVRRAFSGTLIATLIGVLVLSTGLVSAATVTVAFSGYLAQLTPINPQLAQWLLVTAISLLNFRGIRESSNVNLVFTAIELSGLIAVIVVGLTLVDAGATARLWQNAAQFDALPILTGVTLAFFAYVGFEDLCNLAEECKNPARDLPRAIVTAILVTTVVYLLVTALLIITIPEAAIASSTTPLLLVFERAGMTWVLGAFSIVAMIAITNTGLINLIMASRLLYGMSSEGLLPPFISRIHAGRKTPWVGVVIGYALVLGLVFTGGLKILAQTSSFLILLTFCLVHVSLIRIQRRKESHTGMRFPMIVPIVGACACVGLLCIYPFAVYLRSLIVIGIGVAVWMVQRGR